VVRPKVRRVTSDTANPTTHTARDTDNETRPRHGSRRRCSNPKNKPGGCRGFAKRHSDPAACRDCDGADRTTKRRRVDGETGAITTKNTGIVRVPDRVAALLDGTLDVSELDEEELARGYPRAADGSVRNPAQVIPRQVFNRLQRELFERANRELKSGLVDVAKMMVSFANNTELDPKVRVDCGKWVTERIMGKPEQSLTLDVRKYETIFEGTDRSVYDLSEDDPDDGREA